MSTENDQRDVWRLSKTGHQKLTEWHLATREVADLKDKLTQANARLNQSVKSLGDWLCPANSKQGEIFNISIGDGFLQVKCEGNEQYTEYSVSWRVGPGLETLSKLRR